MILLARSLVEPWHVVLLMVPCFLLLIVVWALRYKKAGPDEVMVISGRKHHGVDRTGRRRVVGQRLVLGGGTFVWPIVEQMKRLSLRPVEVEFEVDRVVTPDGAPVTVFAAVQVKAGRNDQAIELAAGSFLSTGDAGIEATARLVFEEQVRRMFGTLRHAEIDDRRSTLPADLREAAAADLQAVGLETVALTIREIRGVKPR